MAVSFRTNRRTRRAFPVIRGPFKIKNVPIVFEPSLRYKGFEVAGVTHNPLSKVKCGIGGCKRIGPHIHLATQDSRGLISPDRIRKTYAEELIHANQPSGKGTFLSPEKYLDNPDEIMAKSFASAMTQLDEKDVLGKHLTQAMYGEKYEEMMEELRKKEKKK